MDFVMAFVIYLIVLTLFFLSLNNAFSTENKGLDVPFELLMSRIDQIYSNDDFLRRSEINPGKFDTYFYSYSKHCRHSGYFSSVGFYGSGGEKTSIGYPVYGAA